MAGKTEKRRGWHQLFGEVGIPGNQEAWCLHQSLSDPGTNYTQRTSRFQLSVEIRLPELEA